MTRWTIYFRCWLGMTGAGVAAIVINLHENAWLIGAGLVVTGISFIFIMGTSRVVWQTKVALDLLGLVVGLQIVLGGGDSHWGFC